MPEWPNLEANKQTFESGLSDFLEEGGLRVHSVFSERLGEELAPELDSRHKVHQPVCVLGCTETKCWQHVHGKKQEIFCHPVNTDAAPKLSLKPKRDSASLAAAARRRATAQDLKDLRSATTDEVTLVRTMEKVAKEDAKETAEEAKRAQADVKAARKNPLTDDSALQHFFEHNMPKVFCKRSVQHRLYVVGKQMYWEQRLGDTVREVRFDFGMSGICYYDRMDKKVFHKGLNTTIALRDHPDLQFMLSGLDEHKAVFLCSPEFMNFRSNDYPVHKEPKFFRNKVHSVKEMLAYEEPGWETKAYEDRVLLFKLPLAQQVSLLAPHTTEAVGTPA
ncbi:hypothetical protein CYMTET_15980 [Cymbomonas tetramitiformis]|uniref:Uncharacterized protein n=1 Tax=Cymbomonas tetramitiformis TaxID=36881 RepID=A0AAE0GD47_9CHLO|nr:hypothetical protein CYMTET_15980 [Cymbomonas tetramitiformis]